MPRRTPKSTDAKPADAAKPKPEGSAEAAKTDAAKPGDKPADAELDDAAENDAPQTAAPEKSARTGGGLYEFRDERWVELYAKKIEEMIGVLKSKGVPVLWVGLPAIRGPKGTSDMLFLDALYRDAAGKAGITYVDVWDGFVDEAGRFLQKGPDFEGQIRQLRTSDGVFFTRPGARKLAHYVEREVTRLLASRSGPIALPIEPATPDANAVPGQPAPRPLAGPILPLVASSVGTDQLLGGPGSRPAAVDALAARTLVKGEALAAPAGRADDFAWPRREIGREQAKGDTPVAATSPSGTVAATSGQKQLLLPQQPLQPQQKRPFRPAQTEQPSLPAQTGQPSLRDFFGGFGTAPRQPAPPAAGPPRTPIVPGVPRPPGNVGRSAEVRRSAIISPRFSNVTVSDALLLDGASISRGNDRMASRNSASAAAGGAAGASSAAPAQSLFHLRPAARRADYPARFSLPLSGRCERCRRCSHRRPWRS